MLLHDSLPLIQWPPTWNTRTSLQKFFTDVPFWGDAYFLKKHVNSILLQRKELSYDPWKNSSIESIHINNILSIIKTSSNWCNSCFFPEDVFSLIACSDYCNQTIDYTILNSICEILLPKFKFSDSTIFNILCKSGDAPFVAAKNTWTLLETIEYILELKTEKKNGKWYAN